MVEHGSFGSCGFEGGIPSGTTCSYDCLPGFSIDGNLDAANVTCMNGVANTPNYTCTSGMDRCIGVNGCTLGIKACAMPIKANPGPFGSS
jgi:hypothetical protein